MIDKQSQMDQAIFVAKSLFDRGKTSGASANISFIHEDGIYISGTGTCFGFLTSDSFALLDKTGAHISGIAPSREREMHMIIYKNRPNVKAIIHTHSFYSVLWSCLDSADTFDAIPSHTPYLRMILGKVRLVPYAVPGSIELFDLFSRHVCNADGYLLANHGPIVGGADILSTFYAIEELEESAKVAWTLRNR